MTTEILIRVAELLLAMLFILGGLATWRDPKPRVAQLVRSRLSFPKLLVQLNAAIMVFAGLALASNLMPHLASVVLALVLIPTTVFGHAFWTTDGAIRQEQLVHFIKNLAVLGGLVLIAAVVR